jgi:hypothetical protein
MVENRGGYQQPSNPAPVSGPGALSKRTDGGAVDGMTQPTQQYTGFDYGTNGEVNRQQGAADLFGGYPEPSFNLDLNAPTAFLDEPMSAGANYGEGPGYTPEPNRGLVAPTIQNRVFNAMQFDTTGQFEAIYNRLNR